MDKMNPAGDEAKREIEEQSYFIKLNDKRNLVLPGGQILAKKEGGHGARPKYSKVVFLL